MGGAGEDAAEIVQAGQLPGGEEVPFAGHRIAGDAVVGPDDVGVVVAGVVALGGFVDDGVVRDSAVAELLVAVVAEDLFAGGGSDVVGQLQDHVHLHGRRARDVAADAGLGRQRAGLPGLGGLGRKLRVDAALVGAGDGRGEVVVGVGVEPPDV